MKINTQPRTYAYFITSHGFGHASRASAVMSAVYEQDPRVQFHIFTNIPEWFFSQSLQCQFTYHEILADIGLVQESAMVENLSKTLVELAKLYPLRKDLITSLTDQILKLNCRAILCDVAPMGILVGKRAQIPSILVENFTWDWIYEGYLESKPELAKFINYLQDLFQQADYHIQAEPLCKKVNGVSLTTNPVSRKPRTLRSEIRNTLNIPKNKKMVMITMGGIPEKYSFTDKLASLENIQFIVPGSYPVFKQKDNFIFLPHQSHFFHPDLVNASDALVGKIGYSTISEVFHAGIPFLFIARPKFRESPYLVKYVLETIPSIQASEKNLFSGNWIPEIQELLETPKVQRETVNGADQIANLLLGLS